MNSGLEIDDFSEEDRGDDDDADYDVDENYEQKSMSRALSKHIHRLPFYFLVVLLSSETFLFFGEKKFLVNKSATVRATISFFSWREV